LWPTPALTIRSQSTSRIGASPGLCVGRDCVRTCRWWTQLLGKPACSALLVVWNGDPFFFPDEGRKHSVCERRPPTPRSLRDLRSLTHSVRPDLFQSAFRCLPCWHVRSTTQERVEAPRRA
jgi:hypothetical protein